MPAATGRGDLNLKFHAHSFCAGWKKQPPLLARNVRPPAIILMRVSNCSQSRTRKSGMVAPDFCRLNEGAWPAPAAAEFAREEEIRAFNRSVQQLNKRAARQGSQGEGHTIVRENHSLYLGPVERRAIALRQFAALLESATRRRHAHREFGARRCAGTSLESERMFYPAGPANASPAAHAGNDEKPAARDRAFCRPLRDRPRRRSKP